MKPSMTTEKSGELKVVTKETTEFAKVNLSENHRKGGKAKVEKFDKKEFEEKAAKNVVAPVVKSVRAAQGGGNAELAQRRAKMDAENAKRLSDESKSDDASAAKKIAAKAAVRAAKKRVKSGHIRSRSYFIENERVWKARSWNSKRQNYRSAWRNCKEVWRLKRESWQKPRDWRLLQTPLPPLPRARPSPSSPPPSESAATTPSSALIEPVLEEPEFSLPSRDSKEGTAGG